VPIRGLLGGSFDPPHNGHLALARFALDRLGFRDVTFLPASQPPHKAQRRLTEAHHRHAMLVLATLEEPRLRVSLEELTRPGRSYTIDTLRRLGVRAGGAERWCFLAGADTLADIGTWRKGREVLERIDFVIFPRGGTGWADLRRRLPAWAAARLAERPLTGPLRLPPRAPARVHWAPLDPPAVSSSDIRRRAARRANLAGLVPALVAHYIDQYSLYSRRKGAAR
jgi:nicotinate-nucleotide adenylyltransferase